MDKVKTIEKIETIETIETIEKNINQQNDTNNIEKEFINIITEAQICIDNRKDSKKCLFIHGDNGVGKTTFVKNNLSSMQYNIIEFDILSQKNKTVTEFIDEYNSKSRSIMDIFYNRNNTSIILIDNIDLINSIDKNTLTSLIKLLRPKKVRKITNNLVKDNIDDMTINIQIVIIGTNDSDKKIKELMKLCNVIKLDPPSRDTIFRTINSRIDNINPFDIASFLDTNKNTNYYLIDKFVRLHSLSLVDKFCRYSTDNYTNTNVKKINFDILRERLDFNDFNNIINETDRTTVALLYHENIIDYINYNSKINIKIYHNILDNFCFSDYLDRIIFQKQLWQLNEMSFKIKVVYNNKIFHDFIDRYKIRNLVKSNNIRFTKILTKYSSEFNNYTFIISMCLSLEIDRKDLMLLFSKIKNNCINNTNNIIDKRITNKRITDKRITDKNIYNTNNTKIIDFLIDKYNISILDINRLVKFIATITSYNE